MNERKGKILNILVKEYIKTAVPVASGVLAEKYRLGVSPATIRNDMAELEEEGYIAQPHTSAGRVPTEAAFRFYLSGIKERKTNDEKERKIKIPAGISEEKAAKAAARNLSEAADLMVFWAISKQNLFYTGISNLFKQPEFREFELVYDVSNVIDRVDRVVSEIFDRTPDGRHILIGSENPFGDFCGLVMVKYRVSGKTGMFGVLGPMRMDYEKIIRLADRVLGDRQSS